MGKGVQGCQYVPPLVPFLQHRCQETPDMPGAPVLGQGSYAAHPQHAHVMAEINAGVGIGHDAAGHFLLLKGAVYIVMPGAGIILRILVPIKAESNIHDFFSLNKFFGTDGAADHGVCPPSFFSFLIIADSLSPFNGPEKKKRPEQSRPGISSLNPIREVVVRINKQFPHET